MSSPATLTETNQSEEFNMREPNEHIGDTLMLPKPNHRTRLYMINPNGFTLGRHGTMSLTLEHIKHMEVDHVVFPEIKLDTTKSQARKGIHDESCRQFGLGEHKTVMTSSPTTFHTSLKPGGVMATTIGSLTGRILATGYDPLGRWVYTKFRAQAGRIITIIGTYQVVKTNPRTAGPTTVATQLYALYLREGRSEPHNLRKHHSRDLVQFAKECQAKGELIIVTGDFNEVIGIEASGLTRLCTDCALKDIIFERHGETNFATREPGSKVIDYILMDPELEPAVEACGHEPFGFHINSDHRGTFVDFNTATLLDPSTAIMAKMEHRDMISKKAHQIQPYFAHATKHLNDHNWLAGIAQLQTCMNNGTPNSALAEKLDKRRISACLYAGSKVKRYPTAPYSPEIARLRNIDNLLRTVIHQHTSQKDHSAAIEQRILRLGAEDFPIPQSLEACKALHKSNKQLLAATTKEEQRTAELRSKHQQTLIARYTASDDNRAAKRVQQQMRAEATARVWKKCAAARGLTNEGGLSHVLIPTNPHDEPKTCTEWTTIDDPEELIKVLTKRNQTHFGQSKDCTLTSPPFDITMDFEGSCHKAEQLLTGQYDTPEDLDEATKWLLDNMEYITTPDAVDATITEDDFRGKIRAWKERTSTSPASNVHLGHAKAYFATHALDPESEEAEELEEQRTAIMNGHLILLNYAMQFGHSYDRWKVIVNAMLEKDSGVPKIHRLRVIHLYEWDFNLILCTKWRKLLHHVSDNSLVNESVYGSRPGKSSLDPVFTYEMELEISRLARRAMIQFDNDATSCYDRIPCFLANIMSRKYGLNYKACIIQGRTLKEAKYYLKTKLGISEDYVTHSRQLPWFGTGQGSGNSPMYWLLISSTLYDIYQSKAQGATYTSPDGLMTIDLHILGFVDDAKNRTNNFHTDANNTTIDQLITQATADGQLWHDILRSSNQALELPKCKYQAIHFAFDNDGLPHMADPAEAPAELAITDSRGDPVPIQYERNSNGIKYLGCHKAPLGQRDQHGALTKKCKEYAKVINCSQLTRRETQLFYQAIYRLSVEYPLPVCYFTFKELDSIQKPSHRAMVSHCGYNRSTALAVQYGPKYLGGAAFFHLYDLQGYGQVQHFLKFWRTPWTQPGRTLRIAAQWAQVNAGTSIFILSDVNTKLPHLESKWMASLREYLASVHGSIEIDHKPIVPPLQRQHDQYIMDTVIQSGKFGPKDTKRVNCCRLYLNAITISDIATATGDRIDPYYVSGDDLDRTVSTSHNTTVPTNQPMPPLKCWDQWKRACHLFTTGRALKLTQALGHWLVHRDKLRREWTFHHDPISDILYQVRGNGNIHCHERLYHDYDSDPCNTITELPPTATPADIHPAYGNHTYRLLHNRSQWQISANSHHPSHNIQTAVDQLDTWETDLLDQLQFLNRSSTILDRFAAGRLLFCSDGSAAHHQGSFGWILSTPTGERLARCNGPAYGHKISSYRAEGYGLLSVLRFIILMRIEYTITVPWEVTILCDNESMVKNCKKHQDPTTVYPNSTLGSDWDIIVEIWQALKELGPLCKPIFKHVKGHQDRSTPYPALSLSAQLNVDADHLADNFMATHQDKEYSRVTLLPTASCQLNLAPGTATFKMKRELRLARTTEPMIAHLCKRNNWTRDVFDSIDWTAHGRALNRQSKHETTFVKYLNGILPVGRIVHRYDKKYPPECPSCPHTTEETIGHLHLCQALSRDQWRRKTMTEVRKHLETSETPLPVIDLFLQGLHSVLHATPRTDIIVPAGLEPIAAAQQAIGWDQILSGRLALAWQSHQQQYLTQTNRLSDRNSGQSWSTNLTNVIFAQWWELWQMRNEDRHGRDKITQAQAENRQATRELHQLYEHRANLPENLQWILTPPIEEKLQWTTTMLRAWINSFRPIIEKGYSTDLETG